MWREHLEAILLTMVALLVALWGMLYWLSPALLPPGLGGEKLTSPPPRLKSHRTPDPQVLQQAREVVASTLHALELGPDAQFGARQLKLNRDGLVWEVEVLEFYLPPDLDLKEVVSVVRASTTRAGLVWQEVEGRDLTLWLQGWQGNTPLVMLGLVPTFRQVAPRAGGRPRLALVLTDLEKYPDQVEWLPTFEGPITVALPVGSSQAIRVAGQVAQRGGEVVLNWPTPFTDKPARVQPWLRRTLEELPQVQGVWVRSPLPPELRAPLVEALQDQGLYLVTDDEALLTAARAAGALVHPGLRLDVPAGRWPERELDRLKALAVRDGLATGILSAGGGHLAPASAWWAGLGETGFEAVGASMVLDLPLIAEPPTSTSP